MTKLLLTSRRGATILIRVMKDYGMSVVPMPLYRESCSGGRHLMCSVTTAKKVRHTLRSRAKGASLMRFLLGDLGPDCYAALLRSESCEANPDTGLLGDLRER
jgi:hypothetical protein